MQENHRDVDPQTIVSILRNSNHKEVPQDIEPTLILRADQAALDKDLTKEVAKNPALKKSGTAAAHATGAKRWFGWQRADTGSRVDEAEPRASVGPDKCGPAKHRVENQSEMC